MKSNSVQNINPILQTCSEIINSRDFTEFRKILHALIHMPDYSRYLNRILRAAWSQRVAWPSGLRRWFKAPVSSEAWVRIPPLPRFLVKNLIWIFCFIFIVLLMTWSLLIIFFKLFLMNITLIKYKIFTSCYSHTQMRCDVDAIVIYVIEYKRGIKKKTQDSASRTRRASSVARAVVPWCATETVRGWWALSAQKLCTAYKHAEHNRVIARDAFRRSDGLRRFAAPWLTPNRRAWSSK